jgi:hypothetical protein
MAGGFFAHENGFECRVRVFRIVEVDFDRSVKFSLRFPDNKSNLVSIL